MTHPEPFIADTQSERAHQMARLTSALASTAFHMVALYDADETLNLNQPESFGAHCIPMSLDEWAHQLSATADSWSDVAANLRQREREHEDALTAPLRAAGFTYEHPGYWERTFANGASVLLSGADSTGHPTPNDFYISVYAPGAHEAGQEFAFAFRRAVDDPGESTPLTYDQAFAATVAIAERFPAPSPAA